MRCRRKIDSDLGGYDKFRHEFIEAAKAQFGSGWAWLAVKNGKLEIMKTPNAENPLVHGATPILTVDVWEHAYYIDYRNARPKFLEAFVDHLINWDYVEEKLQRRRNRPKPMGWAFAQPQNLPAQLRGPRLDGRLFVRFFFVTFWKMVRDALVAIDAGLPLLHSRLVPFLGRTGLLL